MSYILDALRKADAQRDRQRLPGLQAQPMATADTTRESSTMGYAIGGVLLVGVVSAGAAFWQGSRNDEPMRTAAAPMTAPAAPAAALVPPAPSPVAAEPARTIVPAAPIVVEVPPAPRVARAAASAAAVAKAASAPTAAAAQAAPQAVPQAAPASAAKAPASAAPAAVAQAAPPGVPAIAVTGGVYSPSPAQRMLIVNGQVFNEGSEVAPGVTLEQVQRGRAVLNFRGQRWTVAY
ncbi:general secretion pathway protein GspB [Ramlibacter humi]|uniref:Type II secretion system protein GspB C-terminal domain-containing protein n=1 Tax=Ramlibacter humi TaxID=2530451 RepID=A0A4Z0CAH3_9BURK|nr:general secretion pathway protein GspB [Ramlibacter humi]TFZ08583.1 hypothetical protein EZ216_05355 [Ramlibacter humi]